MVGKIKAVIACEKSGNHKLAEDIMQNIVPHNFITSDGQLDSAIMYDGALPLSHPIMKSFETNIGINSKNSLIKHCKLLGKELSSELPKIQVCRQKISNSIGLIDTFLEQLKK